MRLSRTFATFIPSTYLSNIISGRCSEIQLPLYAWNVLYCTFSFIWSLYPNVFTYFLLPTQKKVSSLMSWLIICTAFDSLRMRLLMLLRWRFIHKHTLPSVVLACWSTHPIFEHSNNNLTSVLAPHILCLDTNSMELTCLVAFLCPVLPTRLPRSLTSADASLPCRLEISVMH